MSESWFCFFASFFLFSDSYSYRRVSLSSCRPSPSLNPQPTPCQSSGAPLCTELKDSECTVGEVAVRETGFPSDHAATDLLTSGATVVVAVDPSKEVAGASQGTALVLSSLPRPASPSGPLASGVQRLDDDVVQQFNATHRLSELTTAWGTFATSFGENFR